MENKENTNNNICCPKFLLPSISSLPNPSPLTSFSNHESTDSIFRASFAQPLSARSPTQPFEGSIIKQELNTSIPKIYEPNTNYDPNNTSYTTTYWPTYYSDCTCQSSRDINGSTGPPYNVSTWSSTTGDISTYNNNQENLENPIPTRSFSYNSNSNNNNTNNNNNNNGRYLPPLTPNYHSINSSPSSHHLGRNSAFTNVQRRKSDITGDQPLKFGSRVLEDKNSISEIQHDSIKSNNYSIQENIDSVLLGLLPEETIKRENYDETPKSEGSKEKKKGRSNWTRKETRSLISAVKLKHKLLLAAQRNADKSRIWSDMFSDHCTRFSGRTLKAFKLRWARLAADYSSVYDCIKSGVEPMDFDYYDEMKEIFGDDVIIGNKPIKSYSIPTLKRKFDDKDEKVAGTSISEENSEDHSLVSPLNSPSPSIFDEINGISSFQRSKRIKVDEEVKIVLQEVENTQRKCKKIIEQLKDFTKEF